MTAPTLEARLAAREKPRRSVAMYQRWNDLAFLHWEVEPDIVQASLPQGLHVDTFDGRAYIGFVPFFMNAIRPRGLPCLPWLSNFLELNVRTYVHDSRGIPGVWFYSLECNQPVAVWVAKTFYKLPYHHAKMHATRDALGIRYSSLRKSAGYRARCDYSIGAKTRLAEPGTLDFWLIERYFLYCTRAGKLFRGQVHHQPYPLSDVALGDYDFTELMPSGFPKFSKSPVHAIASSGVNVEVFGIEQIH